MQVAFVLLAAGGGSRFLGSLERSEGVSEPTHKLLARLRNGRTVVEAAYRAMWEAAEPETPLLVVEGAAVLPELPGARVLHNQHWRDGQATSLQVAIAAVQSLECDAVIVGLGDSPGIVEHDWRRINEAMCNGSSIAVATFDGKRGNPVGLARSVWPLLPIEGDEGARSVIVRNPHLVTEVACLGNSADIDTVEDLRTWP